MQKLKLPLSFCREEQSTKAEYGKKDCGPVI